MAEEIAEEIEKIDKKELSVFVAQLKYPLYFMDFESYMGPIPEYVGHWPYRQVPFQFSVHRQEQPGGELAHKAFLAPEGCDPCPQFVEQLVNAMGDKGSVVVYNAGFERTRIEELKGDYPQYKRALTNIQSRLVDLMTPFRKKHLYLPTMNGSYSLKSVLPALVPELSYAGLEIGNGADANTAFYNLRFEKDEKKKEETREALLTYCELDTLAMVRVLEKVERVASS